MSIAKRVLVGLVASSCWVGLAHANEPEFLDFDKENIYIGGGLSYNSLSGGFDDAVGLQGFAGWDFMRIGGLTVAGEAGVFTTGSFSYDFGGSESLEGLYINGVAKYDLTDALWVQARAGTNFSDTGAGMVGGGVGFRVTESISVRAEAARYGSVTSLMRVDVVMTF
ncbi:hypothetical protein [Marinimicrobium sp. ABcell2]|uniref:hypothetical protein n=1 Tax=Marinimicrobium sp. ABcell2 TaxID=3069751 RepID=UPI0027B0735F|nr:hypothetical protein [Marinimicrobium sp. ABcell2]MDQ2077648.1 hypothetical protein [Marinimicrobium sp. ABcell2]